MEKRGVRGAQQSVGVELVIGIYARADAYADERLALLDDEWFLKGTHERAASARDFLHVGGSLQNHRKFVATQARGESAELGRLTQTVGNTLQHQIAECMPMLSLMFLKLSRSMKNTPTCVPSRAAALIDMFRYESN